MQVIPIATSNFAHNYNYFSSFQGMVDCASKTIKREGVRGLYKGMSAPIAGKKSYYIKTSCEATKKKDKSCKTSFTLTSFECELDL